MSEKWIVPCNTHFFDIVSYLNDNDTVVWKKSYGIKNNDTVYIYVGKPYSEIKYRCKVIDDHVSIEVLQRNRYAVTYKANRTTPYMLLKLEYCYPSGSLPLLALKENGLGQIQRQARVYKTTSDFIDSIEKEILERR